MIIETLSSNRFFHNYLLQRERVLITWRAVVYQWTIMDFSRHVKYHYYHLKSRDLHTYATSHYLQTVHKKNS
jgi:hypothetical protein